MSSDVSKAGVVVVGRSPAVDIISKAGAVVIGRTPTFDLISKAGVVVVMRPPATTTRRRQIINC